MKHFIYITWHVWFIFSTVGVWIFNNNNNNNYYYYYYNSNNNNNNNDLIWVSSLFIALRHTNWGHCKLKLIQLKLYHKQVFEERGKPEYPGKNLSEKRRESTNSTHIWRRNWDRTHHYATTALRPCFNMTTRNLRNNNNTNNNSDDDDDDDDDDDNNLLVNGKSLNVCSKCSCPLCQEN